MSKDPPFLQTHLILPSPLGHESDLHKPSAKTRRAPTKRTPKHPLITIANSTDKSAAEAGLDRWKAAHLEAARHLAVDDVLIDRMRGASSIWYRIRLNLRNVPEDTAPRNPHPILTTIPPAPGVKAASLGKLINHV